MRGVGAIAAANSMAQHAGAAEAQMPENPLASWNDGPAKAAILNFVRAVTDPSSKSFVAPEDRIATFDQDGTLWVEHPVYSQAMFALDRVHALAPQHPEWQAQEHLKAVLSNDRAAMARFTEGDWAEIIFLDSCRHEPGSLPRDRWALAGNSEGCQVSAALHRTCLSADA